MAIKLNAFDEVMSAYFNGYSYDKELISRCFNMET